MISSGGRSRCRGAPVNGELISRRVGDLTPDGWTRRRLSECANLRTERALPDATDARRYVALEHLAQGRPAILGWFPAGRAISAKTVFHKGDVLFGKLRPNLRKVAPAPFDGLCSTDILPIFGKDNVETHYLLQLAQWNDLHQHAVSTASGTKMPRTSWRQLAEFVVKLPPLAEQRKIAAILASVDNAIEKTHAVIDQVQVVKRGLMQELLTRGLPGRHKRLKQTKIGELPEDWIVDQIGQLGAGERPAVKAGPFGSSLKKSYYTSDGYRVYGQEQVLAGDLSTGNYYIGEERFNSLRSCEVQTGDILVSIVGTIGKAVVAPADAEPGIINPRLLRLSLDPNLILPEFFCFWLQNSAIQKQLVDVAQGGTMRILNAGIVKKLSLGRPPLSEQAEIVTLLAAIERRLDKESAKMAAATGFKAALMSILLTGELRVTLNPKVP